MWQTHPLDDKTYNFLNQSLQPMWQASAPTVPLTPHLLTSVKIKLQPPAIMQQTSGRRLWQSLPPIVATANQNCEWILDSLPKTGYEMPDVQTSTWVIWKNYVVTSENKSNKKTTTRTTRQQEQEQQDDHNNNNTNTNTTTTTTTTTNNNNNNNNNNHNHNHNHNLNLNLNHNGDDCDKKKTMSLWSSGRSLSALWAKRIWLFLSLFLSSIGQFSFWVFDQLWILL